MSKKPRRPRPAPPVQAPPEPTSRIALGLIERFTEKSFEFAKDVLADHLKIGLAVIAGVVLLVVVYEVVSKPKCIRLKTEYIHELNTCDSSEQSDQEVPIEGLHENIYTDLANRFSIKIPDPQRWSIIPAEDKADDSGGIAKTITIPPGLIAYGPQDITIRTDDAAVVFLGHKTAEVNIASLWVFRITGRTGPIDDLVKQESGEQGGLRRTGATTVPFAIGRALSGKPLDASKGSGPAGRVTPDNLVVAPDHRSALLLWQSPYEGTDMDIAGRFVVGPKDTFYIVALIPKPTNDDDKTINEQLHTMIQSFRPF